MYSDLQKAVKNIESKPEAKSETEVKTEVLLLFINKIALSFLFTFLNAVLTLLL